MTKTKLISSFGGVVAASLLASPVAQASENPFAMQNTNSAIHLAEGMKAAEGKCGDKMKEGGCSGKMSKAKDGKCSEGKCGDSMKMKEGGCSGSMGKMKEGKCSEGKCGDKMKKMAAPKT